MWVLGINVRLLGLGESVFTNIYQSYLAGPAASFSSERMQQLWISMMGFKEEYSQIFNQPKNWGGWRDGSVIDGTG